MLRFLIAEAAEADDDSVRVRMQPTANPSDMAIAQDPNHTPVEGELDFEEATDEALEAQAKWGAQQALLAAQERTKNFDESVKEHRESNIALNQSDRKCLIIIRQPGERIYEKQLTQCSLICVCVCS